MFFKKFFLPLILLSFFLLGACGNKTMIDETHTFDNNTWNRFKYEDFEVNVPNAEDYYRIDFEVVVDSSLMRNDDIPMTVNLYSPEGERRMFYTSVVLRENGRWKGEPLPGRQKEGIRVISRTIRPFFSFNHKGTYRLQIGQATSQYALEGVYSLRVNIEKAELDYGGMK